MNKKRLTFTVTNDLTYDQRMIRICASLAKAGFDVLLIGRKQTHSLPLQSKSFRQKRIFCFAEKGKLFYLEYNLRLFFYLLFIKFDLICAIDLDTILPCLYVSKIKKTKRVYDAHELFCEMKEVVSRPRIYKVWKAIEKFAVPQFKYGYTVNSYIQNILQKDYGVHYQVIQNIPVLDPALNNSQPENFIIYQGAVNEGRSFETLIPAFQWIDVPLFIYGDGNFMQQAKELVEKFQLQQKVVFKGKAKPHNLKKITPEALLGITLFENNGLNNYYSLANRFFDYIHAGIPQICVDYPAYREINDRYNIGVLVTDLSPKSLATEINKVINNHQLQSELRQNCIKAKQEINWQTEEKKLLQFYSQIVEH